MAKKRIKPALLKCVVNMSHLRIEELDDNCEPIVENKEDFNGAPYRQTREVTYVKGDEIFLPKEYIERLGKSVSLVMAPVEMRPVTAEYEKPEESTKTPTVADTIPKPDNKE